jgi:hypothetical protein
MKLMRALALPMGPVQMSKGGLFDLPDAAKQTLAFLRILLSSWPLNCHALDSRVLL